MLAADHCAEAYATNLQKTFMSSARLEATEFHVPTWR